MNKIISHIERNRLAFIISLIYVGIGTLAVCSISGRDPLYGEWSLYALIFTLPVTIISFWLPVWRSRLFITSFNHSIYNIYIMLLIFDIANKKKKTDELQNTNLNKRKIIKFLVNYKK